MTEDELFNNVKTFAKYASKDLGQNYLVNKEFCKKIVSLIPDGEQLLEIGSGFASLSFFINFKKFKKVFLNEIDLRSISFLEDLFKEEKNFCVINKSFLKLDIKTYDIIFGNLPYYITTHIFEKILIEAEGLKKGVFMVQKEFFERLVGSGKDYGPMKVLADAICEIKKEFIINRNDFLPHPNVDSLVFTIEINNQKEVKWKKGFFNFLNKMFLHRRKTIFNNLSIFLKSKIEASSLLKQSNIEMNLRPEQISSEKYKELFEHLLK